MSSPSGESLGSDAPILTAVQKGVKAADQAQRCEIDEFPPENLIAVQVEIAGFRQDHQPIIGNVEVSQMGMEQPDSQPDLVSDGLAGVDRCSSSMCNLVPASYGVEELWMKVGDECEGFRLARVRIGEVRNLVLQVKPPIPVEVERVGVLIIDSNEQVRAGIRASISSSSRVDVLGEAGTYRGAVQLALQLSPDVILMDVMLPDGDGIEATVVIKRELPRTNVILLTAREDVDCLIRAVDAGAVGYLVKGTKRNDLLSAIQSAAGSTAVIDRALLPALVKRISCPPRIPKPSWVEGRDKLTRREQEVLDLIVDGLNNKEISDVLCVTVDTVKSHVHRIIQKLEVPDRTKAAILAIRNEARSQL